MPASYAGVPTRCLTDLAIPGSNLAHFDALWGRAGAGPEGKTRVTDEQRRPILAVPFSARRGVPGASGAVAGWFFRPGDGPSPQFPEKIGFPGKNAVDSPHGPFYSPWSCCVCGV